MSETEVPVPVGVQRIDPRSLIEAAREVAKKSRDLMLPQLREVYNIVPDEGVREAGILLEVQLRMEIVMDCFLTGAEQTLRQLHGDQEPEPWKDDYSHEDRLRELLAKYGLLAGKEPVDGDV